MKRLKLGSFRSGITIAAVLSGCASHVEAPTPKAMSSPPNQEWRTMELVRGNTRLHLAAAYADASGLEELVKSGAEVDAKNDNGWTALHFAVRSDSVECVRLLARFGANVNSQTVNGIAPLHIAALDDDGEMIEVLLALGADKKLKSKDGSIAADFSSTKSSSWTLLQ